MTKKDIQFMRTALYIRLTEFVSLKVNVRSWHKSSLEAYMISYIMIVVNKSSRQITHRFKWQTKRNIMHVCCTMVDWFHCRQRAPVEIVLSSSGTSQLGMFDIQATTKSKYYDHIVLLYLESRRCRYRSIILVCFYLHLSVVNLIDYSDIDKMMDINNEKC
jgi:hypothetical protein